MPEAGQGSGGNVLAAIASVFVPGLGQLVQGRLAKAAFMFIVAGVAYFTVIGWPLGALVHLWSIIDAARWKPGFGPD